MTQRKRLPDRRPSMTYKITWNNHNFSITIGFDPIDGVMREVFFADGQKTGTDIQHTIADTCVVLSIAMQNDVPVSSFVKSLGVIPEFGAERPASPIGAIVNALLQVEFKQ